MAVIIFENGSQLIIPVEEFDFEVQDGIHLTVEFKPDIKNRKKLRKETKNLQSELLKRTEEIDEKKII